MKSTPVAIYSLNPLWASVICLHQDQSRSKEGRSSSANEICYFDEVYSSWPNVPSNSMLELAGLASALSLRPRSAASVPVVRDQNGWRSCGNWERLDLQRRLSRRGRKRSVAFPWVASLGGAIPFQRLLRPIQAPRSMPSHY